MANQGDKVLTVEEEQALLRPIDERVSAIQAKIDELRRDGTDRVVKLQGDIDATKRDRILTKEEREALAKQREAETKEAEKIASAWSKGGLGRWWARLQSSPDKVTWGMAIVALGVVYGDIGTSPMYVMKSIIEGNGGLAQTSQELVIGSLSLVIWTITLLTTIKHVLIAMRANNHGEGGIFALYALVVLVVFGAIEAVFFVSSLGKFIHGGYVAVIMALSIPFYRPEAKTQ